MLFSNFKSSSKVVTEDDLLRKIVKFEARLGGKLFDNQEFKSHPKSKIKMSYEFFCFDELTWVLSKLRIDLKTKQHRQIIIRYQIRAGYIYKQINGSSDWQQLSLSEAENLQTAIELYKSKVLARLYPDNNWTKEK